MLVNLIFANRSDLKIQPAFLRWKEEFPQVAFITTSLTAVQEVNVPYTAPTVIIGSYKSDTHSHEVVGESKDGFQLFVSAINSQQRLLFEPAYILPENSRVSFERKTYTGNFVSRKNEVALLSHDGRTKTVSIWKIKASCPRVEALSQKEEAAEVDFEHFFAVLFFKEFDYSCKSDERILELLELMTGLKKPVYEDVEPEADEALLSGVLKIAFSKDEIVRFLKNGAKRVLFNKPGVNFPGSRIDDKFICRFVRPDGAKFVSVEFFFSARSGTYTREFFINLHKSESERELEIVKRLVELNSKQFLEFLGSADTDLSAMDLLQDSLNGVLK